MMLSDEHAGDARTGARRARWMPYLRVELACVTLWACMTLWAGAAMAAPVQGTAEPRVERNLFVPMRDGVRLATDLYLPATTTGPVPVVLIRTPYSKDAKHAAFLADRDSIIRFFASNGYAVVIQDKRGRFQSEGDYVVSIGDDLDGYDTVDWLARQDWSNAHIGTFGCSYEGDVQLFMAGQKHPALKALIPQASGSAMGSLDHQYRYFGVRVGGAAEWAGSIGWFGSHGQKVFPRLPAGLDRAEYNANDRLWERARKPSPVDFWKAVWHLPMKDALAAQGMPATDFADNISRAPTDPYWSGLPYMTPGYTSDVPALFINSWYDFGADVTLAEFNHLRAHSVSQTARDNQFAIISPHSHCSFERGASEHTRIGDLDVGDTRFDYRQTYLTWFDAWLKEDPSARKAIRAWPKLRYYNMGSNRWKQAGEWPVAGTREREFLLDSTRGANSLSGDGVLREQAQQDGAASDRYVYDPANPVPSRGGSMCCTGSPDAVAGALDQRPIEARSDVLVYTSEPLAQALDITGIPRVVLHVSSDVVDTDFTAKLVDVHPDGRAFNILEGILRARYREGQDKEVWMAPGGVYEVIIPLGATSNVFLPGHRIRLEISSSNFPRFDRNLNLGGVNAEHTTWRVANNTIHHTPQLRSRLLLPVVPQQVK